MRSLERRFKIEQDKNPYYSTLVNFGHAVQYQRFSRKTIELWFFELVDKEDYDKNDTEDVLIHLLGLSHSEKPRKEISDNS